ncbi:protein of unknown function (plasmid) [Pararobbsia alpina]
MHCRNHTFIGEVAGYVTLQALRLAGHRCGSGRHENVVPALMLAHGEKVAKGVDWYVSQG